MNLSQRLDQARRQREHGPATTVAERDYRLRLAREDRTYDGTDLRTGERLTEERWQALRGDAQPGGGLPAWNPDRANEEVSIDWRLDLTPGPGAEVIDLRSRTL